MGKRLTTEDFIEKAKLVHGDKYDYSKVVYVDKKTKIIIICTIHGEFTQAPSDHTSGCGCPKCSGKNITTEEFIDRASKKHNYIYDYSRVVYVDSKTKVKVICKTHGEFETEASGHLSGRGCPKCVGRNKTSDDFIGECLIKHGDKYDYSKVEYVSCNKEVIIICPIHGEFKQKPTVHLTNKHGCPKCGVLNRTLLSKLKEDEFIVRANAVHNNKYKYLNYGSKVHDKIDILCPEHGLFSQKIYSHLDGHGCPICGIKDAFLKNRLEWSDVLKSFTKKHGFRYDYSNSEYVNNKNPISIICSEHGEFKQSPYLHSFGSGCPLCGYENSAKLRLLPVDTIISDFKRANNDKYDYSKFIYINGKTKGIAICHEKDRDGVEHGEFLIVPATHKTGVGCPKCAMLNNLSEKNCTII